jgi:hypothetical protein
MLFTFSRNIIAGFEIRSGIPLSYVLMPHGSFSWFYFPVSTYLFLGIATLLASLSLIVIGKHISKTPRNLTLGLFSYTLLYGFIVPLWLIRATSDVLFGKRRGWR